MVGNMKFTIANLNICNFPSVGVLIQHNREPLRKESLQNVHMFSQRLLRLGLHLLLSVHLVFLRVISYDQTDNTVL